MGQLFSDSSLYHQYKSEKDTEGLLSQKTWDDLNLNDFFESVDYTASCVGRQYLYHLLHYNRLSEIAGLENIIRTFSEDNTLRTSVQTDLKKLDSTDAYHIVSLFSMAHPEYSRRFYSLLQILQFLPTLSLGLCIVTSSYYYLIPLCISFFVNLFLHYRAKAQMQGYFFSVPQLCKLLKQAGRLAENPLYVSIDKDIQGVLKSLHSLRKNLSTFNLSLRLESDAAIILYLFAELANIFFLREVIPVAKAFFLLRGRQSELERVFRFFGLVDVLCSVSQLRDDLPYFTLPEDGKDDETFHVEGLYHPLVENCVSNDITLRGKSVLITGSNMSGKTTFVRAIGLSLLSGQALHTCFARSYRLAATTSLLSAIHMEDSLVEGKSFFLQEVETVKSMLEKSGRGHHLFLLDELFKGTNTTERIAIAKAVLSALAKQNNIVFASTHDIELASLLNDEYDLYHFCESVAEATLSFDYKLKPGPVTERNAIRIIEMCGYPQEVVREAYVLAGKN